MTRAILLTVVLGFLAGCSNEVIDLKSPCVGAEGSPCDRRAVNNELQG